MRIVLDTNVVVSAMLWRGTPHRLRDAVQRNPDIRLFTSAVLLDELAKVLARPFATRRLALIGASARTLITDYALAADVVTPLAVPIVVAADPDDDHVIAAAVAAEADLIVSGDRHLLGLGTHNGIRANFGSRTAAHSTKCARRIKIPAMKTIQPIVRRTGCERGPGVNP